MKSFKWWRNEANREAAKSIAEILQIVVPAFAVVGIAFAGWFGYKSTEKPAAETTQGDNSTYQKGDGLNFAINIPQTIVNGLTIEQHLEILEKREADLRRDLARASDAENGLIQQQLDVVASKLSDIQASYEQSLEDLRLLRERLKEFEGKVPPEQLRAAQEAVYRGDTESADKLFADLEKLLEDEVVLASKAAFGRGQIAETEIRWHDAAKHYATAARLNPTYDTLRKASEFVQRAGDYAKALRLSDELLVWARKNGTQVQESDALNEQAINLRRQGNYPQAEALFLQALEIDKATLGIAHPNYAVRLNNLAEVIQAQGRYPEAEALYLQALEIDKDTIGSAHPDYAIHLNNLAEVIKVQGRNPEAEALYLQTLEIGKATIGTAHPDYASRLSNLAGAIKAQGRYPEAEVLYLQALEIGKATIGTAHPSYAIRLNNLAGVVRAQGRYPEAEALYQQALEIDKASIGTVHPEYAIYLNNLAGVVEAQGRNDEARGYYTQALVIFRDKLGEGHPYMKSVALSLLSLLQSHFPDDPEIPALQALLAANP